MKNNKHNKHIGQPCYNCDNIGITREHIIPDFVLCKNEAGLTVPCCETCRAKLNWLDDNAACYFRIYNNENEENQRKGFRQLMRQNGSPTSVRFFNYKKTISDGERLVGDIVVDEDILMRFIHKVCVGVSCYLFGKLDDSYKIHIFNNFSKLGGFCEYNDSGDLSYTAEQTAKIEKVRDDAYSEFKNKTINIYGRQLYKTNNSLILYTNKQVYDAYWIDITLFSRYKILCAVTNATVLESDMSRNMVKAILPIRIDLNDSNRCFTDKKNVARGDSISKMLFPFPDDTFLHSFLKDRLKEDGFLVSDKDLEILSKRFVKFARSEQNIVKWEKQSLELAKKELKDDKFNLNMANSPYLEKS